MRADGAGDAGDEQPFGPAGAEQVDTPIDAARPAGHHDNAVGPDAVVAALGQQQHPQRKTEHPDEHCGGDNADQRASHSLSLRLRKTVSLAVTAASSAASTGSAARAGQTRAGIPTLPSRPAPGATTPTRQDRTHDVWGKSGSVKG